MKSLLIISRFVLASSIAFSVDSESHEKTFVSSMFNPIPQSGGDTVSLDIDKGRRDLIVCGARVNDSETGDRGRSHYFVRGNIFGQMLHWRFFVAIATVSGRAHAARRYPGTPFSV
jgi:hypothetical protein